VEELKKLASPGKFALGRLAAAACLALGFFRRPAHNDGDEQTLLHHHGH
jgi:hypothetical protein